MGSIFLCTTPFTLLCSDLIPCRKYTDRWVLELPRGILKLVIHEAVFLWRASEAKLGPTLDERHIGQGNALPRVIPTQASFSHCTIPVACAP